MGTARSTIFTISGINNTNNHMIIRQASKQHANAIAKAVIMAVGEDICNSFAAPDHSTADVERLFTHLASLDDSQYSYRNSLVALTGNGDVAGVCIGYDGALLHTLRQRFFEAAKAMLGRDMERMDDETSPDEFYLDTLAVMPQHRGKGIGSALLKAMAQHAKATNKPAALLVDKANPKAEALYRSLGFRYIDDRPFAGVMMSHMRLMP